MNKNAVVAAWHCVVDESISHYRVANLETLLGKTQKVVHTRSILLLSLKVIFSCRV